MKHRKLIQTLGGMVVVIVPAASIVIPFATIAEKNKEEYKVPLFITKRSISFLDLDNRDSLKKITPSEITQDNKIVAGGEYGFTYQGKKGKIFIENSYIMKDEDGNPVKDGNNEVVVVNKVQADDKDGELSFKATITYDGYTYKDLAGFSISGLLHNAEKAQGTRITKLENALEQITNKKIEDQIAIISKHANEITVDEIRSLIPTLDGISGLNNSLGSDPHPVTEELKHIDIKLIPSNGSLKIELKDNKNGWSKTFDINGFRTYERELMEILEYHNKHGKAELVQYITDEVKDSSVENTAISKAQMGKIIRRALQGLGVEANVYNLIDDEHDIELNSNIDKSLIVSIINHTSKPISFEIKDSFKSKYSSYAEQDKVILQTLDTQLKTVGNINPHNITSADLVPTEIHNLLYKTGHSIHGVAEFSSFVAGDDGSLTINIKSNIAHYPGVAPMATIKFTGFESKADRERNNADRVLQTITAIDIYDLLVQGNQSQDIAPVDAVNQFLKDHPSKKIDITKGAGNAQTTFTIYFDKIIAKNDEGEVEWAARITYMQNNVEILHKELSGTFEHFQTKTDRLNLKAKAAAQTIDIALINQHILAGMDQTNIEADKFKFPTTLHIEVDGVHFTVLLTKGTVNNDTGKIEWTADIKYGNVSEKNISNGEILGFQTNEDREKLAIEKALANITSSQISDEIKGSTDISGTLPKDFNVSTITITQDGKDFEITITKVKDDTLNANGVMPWIADITSTAYVDIKSLGMNGQIIGFKTEAALDNDIAIAAAIKITDADINEAIKNGKDISIIGVNDFQLPAGNVIITKDGIPFELILKPSGLVKDDIAGKIDWEFAIHNDKMTNDINRAGVIDGFEKESERLTKHANEALKHISVQNINEFIKNQEGITIDTDPETFNGPAEIKITEKDDKGNDIEFTIKLTYNKDSQSNEAGKVPWTAEVSYKDPAKNVDVSKQLSGAITGMETGQIKKVKAVDEALAISDTQIAQLINNKIIENHDITTQTTEGFSLPKAVKISLKDAKQNDIVFTAELTFVKDDVAGSISWTSKIWSAIDASKIKTSVVGDISGFMTKEEYEKNVVKDMVSKLNHNDLDPLFQFDQNKYPSEIPMTNAEVTVAKTIHDNIYGDLDIEVKISVDRTSQNDDATEVQGKIAWATKTDATYTINGTTSGSVTGLNVITGQRSGFLTKDQWNTREIKQAFDTLVNEAGHAQINDALANQKSLVDGNHVDWNQFKIALKLQPAVMALTDEQKALLDQKWSIHGLQSTLPADPLAATTAKMSFGFDGFPQEIKINGFLSQQASEEQIVQQIIINKEITVAYINAEASRKGGNPTTSKEAGVYLADFQVELAKTGGKMEFDYKGHKLVAKLVKGDVDAKLGSIAWEVEVDWAVKELGTKQTLSGSLNGFKTDIIRYKEKLKVYINHLDANSHYLNLMVDPNTNPETIKLGRVQDLINRDLNAQKDPSDTDVYEITNSHLSIKPNIVDGKLSIDIDVLGINKTIILSGFEKLAETSKPLVVVEAGQSTDQYRIEKLKNSGSVIGTKSDPTPFHKPNQPLNIKTLYLPKAEQIMSGNFKAEPFLTEVILPKLKNPIIDASGNANNFYGLPLKSIKTLVLDSVTSLVINDQPFRWFDSIMRAESVTDSIEHLSLKNVEAIPFSWDGNKNYHYVFKNSPITYLDIRNIKYYFGGYSNTNHHMGIARDSFSKIVNKPSTHLILSKTWKGKYLQPYFGVIDRVTIEYI